MKIDAQLKEELKKYVLERQNKSQNKVIILSSYKLGNDDLELLKKNMNFLVKSEIINVVDQSLLAGVVIKFGTKIIDLSLRAELQNLEHIIYGNT